MDKIQAVFVIVSDARSKTATVTGLKKLRKAGKDLGFTDQEQIRLEQQLEYRNSDGDLYEYFIKRGAK